jgi:hypothetical protein
MTLKANGSFGFGGSGSGGGGGGEVNTASNVGTGVQVFKQKTGVDLEFRTLLPNGVSANNTIVLDQNADTIDFSVRTGTFGISNGQGYYTFYTTLSAAITAATSGQTIVMFDNVTETTATPINLKSDVNIDLNGHTYTLDVADAANAFQDNGVSVKVVISNGLIQRSNALSPTSTNSTVLKLSNAGSEVTLSNVQLLNNTGSALYTLGKVFGGLITSNWSEGNTGVYIDGTDSQLVGTNVIGNTTMFVGGTIKKCYVYSENFNATPRLLSVAIDTSGIIEDCIVESNLGYAIQSTSAKISNTIAYSVAQIAYNEVGVSSRISNCYFRSSGSYAMNGAIINSTNCVCESDVTFAANAGTSEHTDSIFISAISSAYNSPSNCKFFGCTFKPESGLSGVHGLRLLLGIDYIIGCRFEVNNLANFAVIGTNGTPTNIYAVNNNAFGSAVMFDNVTNLQSNTPDLYGNILVG